MKKHPDQKPKQLNQAQRELCEALATLRDADEIEAFMEDLCTPAELEALVDRWRVVRLLQEGLPYRKIHDISSVSVTTIGRVARFLEQGAGGYRLALQRMADED